VCERKCFFEMFCPSCACRKTQMLVPSAIDHGRHPRACVALVCCRLPACCHTHLKNMLTENFVGNENFWIFASSIIIELQNVARLLCTVMVSSMRGFPKQNVYVSRNSSPVGHGMLSVVLACVF
jgi:hypothetical protein